MIDPSRPLGNSTHARAEQAQLHLRRRGPDGQQCLRLVAESWLLGHVRLAIIDIEGGAQPTGNEGGTVWVVCNGEIYNYVEWREKLIAESRCYSTRCDAEVLPQRFEEKGALLLDDWEGTYAFAIVDTRKQQLPLARYRFEKPLYRAPIRGGKGQAFASELKAILTPENRGRSLDVAAAAQLLAWAPFPHPELMSRECAGFGPARPW
jgi:asparagine synthase (glutamine-hydrolysing)